MKLDCVLTAVNENLLYLDFVPIFIKTWNKLYPAVDIKIILIAKNIPENLLIYKNNLIIFEPIEDISTSLTSQLIRLLYPCILNYKNGVLITDIDILPMNNTFFTKNIENICDNKWVNLRDWQSNNQFSMCWQVAIPNTWKEVFSIYNLQAIKDTLVSINNRINYIDGIYDDAWFTDQKFLYEKVMQWNKKTNNLIILKDKNTGFNRLNRENFQISDETVRKNITQANYSDYHCYRPMKEYSNINWEIYDLLPITITSINSDK